MRALFGIIFGLSLLAPLPARAQEAQYWCNGARCTYQDWLALQANQPPVLLTHPAQVAEQERSGTGYMVAPAQQQSQASASQQDGEATGWGYQQPRRVEPYYDRSFYEQQTSANYY